MGVKKNTKNHTGSRSRLRLSNQSGGDGKRNQGFDREELRQRIFATVAMIPKGKVASYGQIAKLVGYPSHSRFVGRTLSQLPPRSKLPWFRVVNSSRKLSPRGGGEARQQKLLEAEGVVFMNGTVLKAHLWEARAD